MEAPLCPQCSAPLTLRNGSRGPFWGCSTYPRCRATRDATQADVDARRGPLVDGEREVYEQRCKTLESGVEYWRGAFFDERNWWVRRMAVVTPAITPAELREINAGDQTCAACGQPLPKLGRKDEQTPT